MELELKGGLMGLNMKANISMARNMEEVFFTGQIIQDTKENSKKITYKAKGLICGLMDESL